MTDWIDWPGGECPVDGDALVSIKQRDGEIDGPFRGWELDWYHGQPPQTDDIVGYQAYQPTPPAQSFADLAAKDKEIEQLTQQRDAAVEKMNADHADRQSLLADNDRLRAALAKAREALTGLADVVDAAGLHNLIHGVQLGPTVWYVKARDAMDFARAAIKGEA